MPMVDKSGDAFALWQQMIGEMQKGFDAFARQTLVAPGERRRSEAPSGLPAGPQRPLSDFMESYLVGMNLPSRAQLSEMAERLRAVEHELSEIKALLHRMANSIKSVEPSRQGRSRAKRRSGPGPQSAPAEEGKA
jgi:hypothetical protein